MKKEIIILNNISKTFNTDGLQFSALRNVDLVIEQGEFVGIVGRSGSGKSTLLNVMSGIDKPSSGDVSVNGMSILAKKQGDLDAWRGKEIGLVFQFFHLIPTLTVAENVMLPMDFCKVFPVKERLPRALDLLESVGVSEKAQKFPSILSGGEMQRVAIARSMANDPPIIFGDEPTGNLDSASTEIVFELFETLNKMGKTIIIVSHDVTLEKYSDRTIYLVDGQIEKAHEGVKEYV